VGIGEEWKGGRIEQKVHKFAVSESVCVLLGFAFFRGGTFFVSKVEVYGKEVRDTATRNEVGCETSGDIRQAVDGSCGLCLSVCFLFS